MLDRAEIDALFPEDLPEPAYWEQRYPPRDLPEGAMVTRVGPSPTGSPHIGLVYVAMIDRDIADSTGGTYLIRVEDTDQAREVEGALTQFERAFAYFGIAPDEADEAAWTAADGAYGPYHQSQRSTLYMTYVRELLRQGKAYLCFATKEELERTAKAQQAARLPTGYYGRWATWRDAPAEEVEKRLAAGEPYVVRFRSEAKPGARVRFDDAIRGRLEHEANHNDAVILKSSDSEPRLPTYHFAHAVDDHLMRVNLVIRGEEWISSVPLHLQLFEALGFEQPTYAHIAPLTKLDGGNKRKLSKRKDPEMSTDFYIEAGYPRGGGPALPARTGQRAAGRPAAGGGTVDAARAGGVRRRRAALRHREARGHERRPHRHPVRRDDSGGGQGVGRDLRPAGAVGSRRRARPGSARARRRARGRRQPA